MDETRVAVAKKNNTGAEIWIYDLESGAGTRLTAGGIHGRPLWSADDRWIYYAEVTIEGAFGDVFRVRADGSGPPESVLTAAGDFVYRPEALTADGRTLVVDRARTDAYTPDVLLYDMESAEFEAVADADVGEYNARLSPDGRYVVYARSLEVGSAEARLQIRDLETRATYPVVAHNAHYARWSADGSELFYVQVGINTSDIMMRVPVTLGDRLEVGPPQEMFTVDISLGGSRGFSVTADGQRFLYSELPGSLATNPLEEVRVVVGWLNQLQARVPQR
jgi:Tol biopolymer transport system component